MDVDVPQVWTQSQLVLTCIQLVPGVRFGSVLYHLKTLGKDGEGSSIDSPAADCRDKGRR